MSTTETQSIAKLDQELNDAILAGKALEAFEKFYAEDVEMQENSEAPFAGKAVNRKREVEFFDSVQEFHAAQLVGSAINGHRSYSEWFLDLTFKNGHRAQLAQVAVREWKNGKISKERFYYSKA